jgi:N-acetylglucosamine kinase-like BadF-type ATPase
VLLAIDGGNSKTDAVLLAPGGAYVARLRGPGSGGGPQHVVSVLLGMLQEAAVAPAAITRCSAALAGLDFDEDAAAYRAALQVLLPSAEVDVAGDARAVLDAGGGSGVAIVYGAGFNAAASGPLGTGTHPALGWSTGEWGGGHDLGREAVRIAHRSADGRGPRSALETQVLEATGQPSHSELARAIRDERIGAAEIGALARLLLAAAAGDAAAVDVADRACAEIVELALLVSRQAFGATTPPGTPALLAGGAFRSAYFADRVTRALAEHGLVARRFAGDPVLGVTGELCRRSGVRPTGVPGLGADADADAGGSADADADADAHLGTPADANEGEERA